MPFLFTYIVLCVSLQDKGRRLVAREVAVGRMEGIGNERRLCLPLEVRPNLPGKCDAIPYYDVKHGHFGNAFKPQL